MKDFIRKAFAVYDKEWALVTAGPVDNYNTMTISWGAVGELWGKDVVFAFEPSGLV